jgi:hypothetical protein
MTTTQTIKKTSIIELESEVNRLAQYGWKPASDTAVTWEGEACSIELEKEISETPDQVVAAPRIMGYTREQEVALNEIEAAMKKHGV